MPGLGRIHAPDESDRNFLLAELPQAKVAQRVSHLWAYFDQIMDQGDTGTCVGHGWKGWLATAPVIQSDTQMPPYPFDIYDACIQVDEWTDNDHDTERQFGTSVRAGAKVLQSQGFISEYRWAYDVDTAADWLAGLDARGHFVGGPLVIGINWYESMFYPDRDGFLRIAGSIAGGHCVCLTGWDNRRGFAYGINSWGNLWGKKGRFCMPGEVLARLLSEDGECCTSPEVRKPR
jgi:hypothetical protein